jgi:hypothetical protein
MLYSRWNIEGVKDRKRRFVCKINNSLYGLESASRKLVQEVDSFMLSQVFQEVTVTIVFMVLTILVFRLLTICS